MIKLFCTKCGNQLPEDAQFCGNCGNKIGGQYHEKDQDSTTIAKESKEKKQISFKWPKKNIGIIGLALILVLIIGFVAKDVLVYAMSPEKYILSAVNKTYKSLTKDLKKMETIFGGNISPNTSSTNSIKLLIDNISHTDSWYNDDLYIFKEMGMELSTSIDLNKKQLQLRGKSIYKGEDFVSINAQLDNNELLISLPEIYDKAIALPSKDLGRQWNDSELARQTYNYADESLDISFSNLIDDNLPQKMNEETKRAYMNALKAFTRNAVFEKSGSETLFIGNKDRKCNRTTVILNERDIKDGILELVEAIRNDNRMEQWKETLRSTNQEYVIMGFEEALNAMGNEINQYFEVDRTVFDIYTNKGELVKIDLRFTPDMDYPEEILKISMAFLGEKSPIDDFRFELIAGEYEEGKIVFSSKGNHTGAKKQFTADTRLAIYEYGGELMRLSSVAEIDLSGNKDNLRYNLDLISDDANISLSTKGDFTSTSKKIEYNLEDILLTTKDYYDDSFIFEGSLSLTLEEGAKDITNLKNTEKLQILEITEYDIYDIMSVVESNMYNIMNSLGLY